MPLSQTPSPACNTQTHSRRGITAIDRLTNCDAYMQCVLRSRYDDLCACAHVTTTALLATQEHARNWCDVPAVNLGHSQHIPRSAQSHKYQHASPQLACVDSDKQKRHCGKHPSSPLVLCHDIQAGVHSRVLTGHEAVTTCAYLDNAPSDAGKQTVYVTWGQPAA